ncbi:MAG: 5-(carboxyamino)imidazole ribonucleotide synthase [Sphingosinicella sp.]|uniref:5-(carboxyamino)imidazole ribonucleotide synthase n=1 Tax=Sphingosinicella sp. TaxID=1917971 RepID=UPI0040378834
MSVPPGSTIGIIGGGQLGRMLSMAAAQLGYKCHIYAPDETPPAVEVAAAFTRGAFDDAEALARFAAQVDVVTYEFENIPTHALTAITATAALHPSVRSLEIAQDRLNEKEFVLSLGGRPAPFASVDSRDDLDTALDQLGAPAILKTRRLGYDGKGQARIDAPAGTDAAWEAIKGASSVLEGFVTFDAEFSILLCRGSGGELAIWDAPRNVHANGILDRSIVPAGSALAPAIAKAEGLARRIADAIGHVGMLAIEFFAVGGEAVFNEMAPRVHNSGHWTIEGAATSQFENHIRAICGLPLGATDLEAARVEMTNLIGSDVEAWPALLAERGAHLHLYGKKHPRPGRKMGHVTRLSGRAD